MSNEKKKILKVPAKTVLQYLQLFNGLFELTSKEMEVLAVFVTLHLHLKKTGVQANAFASDMKKKAGEQLGFDNWNHLNVYIKQLADKRAISKIPGGYAIHPFLIPSGEKEIVFRLI
jgi:hypothetical protein